MDLFHFQKWSQCLYLHTKILESLSCSGGINSGSERSWRYGNVSVRISAIAKHHIFAHISYPFLLPLLCVSLKHQGPERGPVVVAPSHGNCCAGVEGSQSLGKLSRAGQGYKAIFFLFQFAMEPNYLHIWPRNTFMMIALPNMVLTQGHVLLGSRMGLVGRNGCGGRDWEGQESQDN